MNFGLYREMLRIAPIRRLLIVGMIARFPHSAAGVLLTLHVVNTMDRGYAAAGAVAAVVTIGIAVGAPWRGRRVDTIGLRKALIPSVIAEAVIWSTAPHVSFEWLLVLALVGGVFTLPVFSVVRQSLGVLATGEQRRTAFALDSIATELIFMMGPALGAVIATQISSVIGLTAVGLSAAVAGLLLIWFNPPTRSPEPEKAVTAVDEQEAAAATAVAVAPANIQEAPMELTGAGLPDGPQNMFERLRHGVAGNFTWFSPAVAVVFAVAIGAGLLLSSTDVGIVASVEAGGNPSEVGIVFVAWCAASAIGGIVYGAMKRRFSPMSLLLTMAVLTMPMAFATDTLSLALLSIPAGLLCAPVLSAASERVADLVAENRRGEAMGWYGSSMTAGTALGAPVAGLAIDVIGPWSGFLLAGGAAAVLVLATLSARRLFLRSAPVR
ncbi:MFS transporter [Arthrobacter zhangbolii]|uniref:MFS transporter n=1 Tax=Arthrobacter zhangbolii TaxID=2886936 RepID=A0A9X1SBS3_9MICC|nr:MULTISPECIES: MFS transporter [Arthrobacter]MCC3273164.1 MFS transporter [Arthrobacter zhangbolii]MCC3295504.1 MFS transporter [Arthrobacter zhangbolii]MDN3905066.1 MFS transporter [Arthrobacter sp. YD2]UON93198.1 MFS transporter [Arthrobacter zhangbolii]